MNPLFSVGEVVILQSVAHPDLNGECTIIECVRSEGVRLVGVGGAIVGLSNGYAYITTIEAPGLLARWSESALRKKHQPGEQSFTELMQTLKNTVSV